MAVEAAQPPMWRVYGHNETIRHLSGVGAHIISGNGVYCLSV